MIEEFKYISVRELQKAHRFVSYSEILDIFQGFTPPEKDITFQAETLQDGRWIVRVQRDGVHLAYVGSLKMLINLTGE